MLAQNFKTAAELGISENEVRALTKVLGMLEREQLHHVPEKSRGHGFNMAISERYTECGTVGCIMGHARAVGGTNLFIRMASFPFFIFNEKKKNLAKLFYPTGCGKRWREISTAEAAIALRNYLTIGEARWSEALAVD